jgi:hypothetical protein
MCDYLRCSKIGLMDVLVTQLRERTDEKVRRRLMAALGELLFYAATQEEDGVCIYIYIYIYIEAFVV